MWIVNTPPEKIREMLVSLTKKAFDLGATMQRHEIHADDASEILVGRVREILLALGFEFK